MPASSRSTTTEDHLVKAIPNTIWCRLDTWSSRLNIAWRLMACCLARPHAHCRSGGDYTCAPGTVESGRPPEQSNDIKQEIVAAYNDSQCNGEIFLLGASSGGTHAAWCALDPTPLPSPATGWPLPAGTIKAVAGLSGVYDLSYRGSDASMTFIDDVVNYTDTTDLGTQLSVSPIHLVASASNIPPFLLFATSDDPVP